MSRHESALDAAGAHLQTPEGCWQSMMRWVNTFEGAERWVELQRMVDAWCARFGGTR